MERDPKLLIPHVMNAEVYGTLEIDSEFLSSVRHFGVLYPVRITDRNVIISGHRRVKAAIMCGLASVPVEVTDHTDAELHLLEGNRYRRKSSEQMGREAIAMNRVLKERGMRRPSLPTATKSDVLRTVAQANGVNSRTVERAAKVVELADSLVATDPDKAAVIMRDLRTGVRRAYDKHIANPDAAMSVRSILKEAFRALEKCQRRVEDIDKITSVSSSGVIESLGPVWDQLMELADLLERDHGVDVGSVAARRPHDAVGPDRQEEASSGSRVYRIREDTTFGDAIAGKPAKGLAGDVLHAPEVTVFTDARELP